MGCVAAGVFNTLDTPIAGLWQATGLKEMLAVYNGDSQPSQLGSLDVAVAAALKDSSNMRPYGIAFP